MDKYIIGAELASFIWIIICLILNHKLKKQIFKWEFKYVECHKKYTTLLRQVEAANVLFASATYFKSDLDKAYEMFGLTQRASLQEVKNKYRSLLKKYHPDINKSKDSLNKFNEIQQAYKLILTK